MKQWIENLFIKNGLEPNNFNLFEKLLLRFYFLFKKEYIIPLPNGIQKGKTNIKCFNIIQWKWKK